MPNHTVVSESEWIDGRKALLKKEKEFTRLRDGLSRQRQALPWVRVEKKYLFDTTAGKKSLADLFDGRHQLIVYHFMLGPGWEEGCPSCSYLMDHVEGMLPHLAARDVTFTAVSRASLGEIEAFRRRMGWCFNWASSNGTDFNFDYGVSFTPEQLKSGKVQYNYAEQKAPPMQEFPGLSAFFKDESGQVFHTYSTYARGLDIIVGTYNYLDMAPLGRNEAGLKHTMSWVRHHDRYEQDYKVDPNAGYVPPKGAVCKHCCAEEK